MISGTMLTLACLSGSLAVGGVQPTAEAIEHATRILRKPAKTQGQYADMRGSDWAYLVLRDAPGFGADGSLSLLRDVIFDRNNPSRAYVLDLTCERASATGASEIVEMLRTLGRGYGGLEPATRPAVFVDPKDADGRLIHPFVRHYAPQLASRMNDPRLLVDLLYQWVVTPAMLSDMPGLGAAICRTIATMPVSLDLRREYVLRIFENYDFWCVDLPPEMLSICDMSMAPRLRACIERGLGHPEAFTSRVAEVLAELGDLGSLAVMNLAETAVIDDDLRRGRAPEDVAGCYSWRIKIQHPPQTILSWLSRKPTDYGADPMNASGRLWMMNRALALGVNHESMRQAIIQSAAGFADAGRAEQLELRQVKTDAVRLGVLQAADLPEIPAYRIFPEDAPSLPSTRPATSGTAMRPPAWKPNRANYEQFWTWFRAQNFQGRWTDERTRLTKLKMCELDLLSPEECVRLAASQPAGSQP